MEDDAVQPVVPGKESPTLVKQRRLLNRWSLFALFFVTAVGTVGYVSNVISVNHLSAEANSMKKQRDSMRVLIQSLRTESYRLQSAERITRIAMDDLGMVPPEEAPAVINE